MYRRKALLAAAGFVALPGCSTIGQAIDSNLANVVTDSNAISNGASDILKNLVGINISSDTMNVIQGAISGIQSVAAAIGAVSSTASAQPLVQKLETYVNALVTAASNIPGLPAIVATVLKAASVLLPVIEQAAGIAVSVLSAQRMKAASPSMTPEQARLILMSTKK